MVVKRSLLIFAGLTTLVLLDAACGSSAGTGSASSDGMYKIGIIQSFTGSLGTIGQDEETGISLALSKINASGGVKGKKLSLAVVDDQGSVSEGTAGMKKLAIDDGVKVVIGPVVTSVAAAVAPMADTYNVLDLVLSNDTALTSNTKNAFNTAASGQADAQEMVNYAVHHGAKTAALIYSNGAYGQEGKSYLTPAASKAGLRMVSENSWDSTGFNFTAQASQAKSANPDVIFLYGVGASEDGLLLKAVVASGYKGLIVGDLSYSFPDILQTAGAAANRIVATTTLDTGDPNPAEAAFMSAYKSKYHKLPDSLAQGGYDSLMLAADVIAKSPSYDGSALVRTLISNKFQGLRGTFAYSEASHGGPGLDAWVTVAWKNGQLVAPSGS